MIESLNSLNGIDITTDDWLAIYQFGTIEEMENLQLPTAEKYSLNNDLEDQNIILNRHSLELLKSNF